MKTIHRFPIDMEEVVDNGGKFEVEAPIGAKILHVDVQERAPFQPSMWVQLEDDRKPVLKHTFEIVGTGHQAPERGEYVGSWQQHGFVWHLYEVIGS